MPHVSIKPEFVFFIKNFGITNSVLTSSIIVLLLLIVGLIFSQQTSQGKKSTFSFFIRFIIEKLYTTFKPILESKTDALFPVLASLFFFILLSNWFGLLPGVGSVTIKAPERLSIEKPIEESIEEPKEKEKIHRVPLLRGSTADLNTTLVLALIAFGLIQFYGFKELGIKYLGKFINFSNPIGFYTGILELISEFSKILSFAFRLFGNIFAGEVLLAVIAFLIPVLASFPFLVLEVFVGFVQAVVFSMLTAVFISSAIAKHH